MKKVMRKIRFFSLLVVTALFVQTAIATTLTILPESSHYQGRRYYRTYTQDGLLSGHIDFAVYDTDDVDGDEFALAGFTAPGSGQYTYAYQIFNDEGDIYAALEYFAISGIGAGAIDDIVTDIGSVDDESDGIDSTTYYFGPHDAGTGPDEAVWEFEGGILEAGKHSFFLALSSDHDYTTGTYTVTKSTVSDAPVPNPEPGTLALLGVGGALTLLRRRRSV